MKAFNINGNKIQAANMSQAFEYTWFAGVMRQVCVDIVRDGEKMMIKLNITAQPLSPFLEDIISHAVRDSLSWIGIEFDSFEVSIDGVWLSSSEL